MTSDRVSAALEGRIPPEALTAEENDAWFDAVTEMIARPSPAASAFFARRRQLGLGVGLDDNGEIVWAKRP